MQQFGKLWVAPTVEDQKLLLEEEELERRQSMGNATPSTTTTTPQDELPPSLREDEQVQMKLKNKELCRLFSLFDKDGTEQWALFEFSRFLSGDAF